MVKGRSNKERGDTLETPKKVGRPVKRVKFSQVEFPQTTLQDAQRIASALEDNFAGEGGSPPDVALALSISPASGVWRNLTGSSIAYGLSEGGYNAASISLTPLGKRLVAPQEEGEDLVARREAILRPNILRQFFEKYRKAKFPTDPIAINVLKSLGVPQQHLDAALGITKANGRYAGIIRDTPTGPSVNLDSPGVPSPAVTPSKETEADDQFDGQAIDAANPEPGADAGTHGGPSTPSPVNSGSNRVFISHGKQKAIAEQIKELLEFGHFEPIVSVERESTAIPVPEKVFEDMRSCSAGVIHVTGEANLLDQDGNQHPKINDNVLIEIGAALALYGKKVVLLVEKGVTLPSNLQGLYRCDYAGEKLEYEATMKLLKTFTQFR